MLHIPAIIIGWALDLLLGDPVWLPHPVVAFGRWIAFCEHRLNHGRWRMAKGAAVAVVSIAAVFARERGINHLVTGVSQTDFSGYPDCRDAFIKSLNVTLNLGMEEQFVIHTPLMWIDKEQTWEMADKLGVLDLVRNETLTCYNGIAGDGCGHCPACTLRREGLERYLRR